MALPRDWPPLAMPDKDGFLWSTGIEDTFISEPNAVTGRTLDEYALTEHYDRWQQDLDLVASLRVPCVRYGIPWYRVNPSPGVFEWSWTDRVLDRLVNHHRIEPIIDLVHYGTPNWLKGSFLDPEYPERVAEYAREFARHYRGMCYWYTPLNEPRVNAYYAGRLGWWPPHRKSWRGFVGIMAQLCRGICLTQRAIVEVEPRAVFVHVDATDHYEAHDPSDEEVVQTARQRQEVVFLALDLVMGRVHAEHPLSAWLLSQGIGEGDLKWFHTNRVRPDAIGYNMYPMYSRKVVYRTREGRIRVRIVHTWSETLRALTDLYAERYAQVPLMVTETASTGPPSRRIRWIRDSVAVVADARKGGQAVVGYTYWPLFSLVTWGYQRGSKTVEDYLIDMGLWDLRPSRQGLERVPTSAADAYRGFVAAGLPEKVFV